jgi:predicted component of type VI protein secretion system
MEKNASIIGFIGLLVLVLFVSGCTSSNNTTSNQTSNVTVQITSNTPWNGTLTYNGTDHKINGTNNSNYNLGAAPGSVTIYLKNDNGTGNSTVQLLQGNTVIQTQTTSENQQTVTISHNF